jgi:hypothetical protein
MKKIVEAIADGKVLGAVPIDLVRFWPFKAPSEASFMRQAAEEFCLRRIRLPADVMFVVRDPREGDPSDY